MLAASSPPSAERRGQSEDEWSLITPNLQEEPCSPGFLGGQPGTQAEQGVLPTQISAREVSFDGKKHNFFGPLSNPGRLGRLATEAASRQPLAHWQSDAPMTSQSSSTSRGSILQEFSASIENELAAPSVTFISQSMSDSGALPALEDDTNGQMAWDQTEQLARDIRQASIGVPEVKAPSVDRYMKIVVAGQPGLGKTTFVNNIRASFGQLGNDLSPAPSLTSHPSMTTAFSGTLHTVKREDDKGNKFHYFLQDTKGFCTMEEAAPLLDSIKVQSESYFKTEQDGKRCQPMAQLVDPRVDVCLYFLPPHTIYPLDVEAIGRISQLVPVIPVMAKADTMTPEELEAYRTEAAQALSASGITIHKFKDEDAIDAGFTASEHIFAVVGSTSIDMSVSRSWPIRNYPWGRVEALNRAHSDVPALKNLVFALSYEDFKEDTEKRYLAYRKARLEGNSVPLAHKASRKLPREPAFQPRPRSSKGAGCAQCRSMPKLWITLLISSAFFLVPRMLDIAYPPQASEVQPAAASEPPAWLSELLQSPTREGAGPMSLGVILAPQEYEATMRLLVDFLTPITGRRTNEQKQALVARTESAFKLLRHAKEDATRYQPPRPPPEPQCPAPVPPECPAASIPASGKLPASTLAKNLLNNLRPISSKVGRELSSGLSTVGREVSAVSIDIGKGLSSVGHDVSQGLSSLNRDAQSSLKAIMPDITLMRDMSANAVDWANREARKEAERLLEHVPSAAAVKNSVSDSARAASSWFQWTARETKSLFVSWTPSKLANETLTDTRRIVRCLTVFFAMV